MMDSASSSLSMAGRAIFLMMTEFPAMEMTTSLDAILALSNAVRIVSATAAASMIWPSTMASWGSGSNPMRRTE